MKRLFIVWGRETALSKYIARDLEAGFRQIYFKRIGSINLPVFIRYIVQGIWTIGVLLFNRPKLVIVQNPPIFASLLVSYYTRVFGSKLMLDSHTAAFVDEKWVKFHNIFKQVAKRADLNTCHNYKNLEILEKWGIRPCMVLQFCNPEYSKELLSKSLEDANIRKILTKYDKYVMMVNRFNIDDDWENVIKTAQDLPNIGFIITGEKPSGIDAKNKNVFFTGYLQHREFIKLMNNVDVVLSLTKRKDTVLWSVREAMALKVPFVTSNFEVMKHYFEEVALFSNHKPHDLAKKIDQAIKDEKKIIEKINKFLQKDNKRWKEEINQVKKYLNIN